MRDWRLLLSCLPVLLLATTVVAQYEYSGTAMYREVEADVYFLASDALEGRAAGQAGEVIAAEYIAARFKAMGVGPGGVDGTYYQPFSVKDANPHSRTDCPEPAAATLNHRPSEKRDAAHRVVPAHRRRGTR